MPISLSPSTVISVLHLLNRQVLRRVLKETALVGTFLNGVRSVVNLIVSLVSPLQLIITKITEDKPMMNFEGKDM